MREDPWSKWELGGGWGVGRRGRALKSRPSSSQKPDQLHVRGWSAFSFPSPFFFHSLPTLPLASTLDSSITVLLTCFIEAHLSSATRARVCVLHYLGNRGGAGQPQLPTPREERLWASLLSKWGILQSHPWGRNCTSKARSPGKWKFCSWARGRGFAGSEVVGWKALEAGPPEMHCWRRRYPHVQDALKSRLLGSGM